MWDRARFHRSTMIGYLTIFVNVIMKYGMTGSLLDKLSELTHNKGMYMSVVSLASGYRSSLRMHMPHHARARGPACHAGLGGSGASAWQTRGRLSVSCGGDDGLDP